MKSLWINEIKNKIGETVELYGWVNARRDHGKIIFIDLRDRSGIAQIVFTPQNAELYRIAETLRPEWVLFVKGEVVSRPEGMVNSEIETGKVEVKMEELKVLSQSETPPFPLDGAGYEIDEELRLKYRYLDLRRERLKDNLIMRHKVIKFMRNYLDERGFIEIETPILTKSTPEGARDYVVPSRLYPGRFYALPQSPQQYKQLLMVAGVERYFQISRCFRDEDTRGDRQPEFTQLDLEMSFTDKDEILNLIENLYTEIVKKITPDKKIIQIPFPRLTYKEAIEKYGTDKPDLRKDKENPDELAFLFIVDFPMFEWKESEKRWDAVHHPFTSPKDEDGNLIVRSSIDWMKKNQAAVLAEQYDFVCNGYEIGGGSIRTHDPEVLTAIFEVLGHSKKDIEKKFGHILTAFKYGVPPHGGIAPGIDRFMMILGNEPNIREVIAFPKTGDAGDPMMESPSEIDKKQLKELNLGIKKK